MTLSSCAPRALAPLLFLGLAASEAAAQTTCPNSGTLGALADGTHAAGVLLDEPGLLGDPYDRAARYANPTSGGAATQSTRVGFRPELNPPATQPFSVEFWAEPAVDPTVVGGAGPCPLFNRQSAGNRTGWVWFQRGASVGWNFAMYSAQGSTVSVDLAGGTAVPLTTNHLVATWDGTTARLYHNGALVDSEARPYVANTGNVTLSVASYDTGDNAYQGVVDDLALYGVALSASQVQAHYLAGVAVAPAVYAAEVARDGALLHWRNADSTLLGASYCSNAVQNSSGYSATISAAGAGVAASNDVTLRTALLPTNAFGFYLTSLQPGSVANPGGSAGNLCLSGAIGRYIGAGQIKNSGTTGSFELTLDLAQHPTPTGFVTVAAGDTWHFQTWYRDVVGGVAVSNFSDGVAVTFQ